MELPCLSEYSSACRTGYSVHRSLLGICPREKACPRGLPARAVPARTTVSRTGILSQTSISFRDTLGRPPYWFTSGEPPDHQGAPPMRFSAPPALKRSESACCSGSTRNAIPLRPFSDPWGFSPHHAPQPCFMLLTLLGFYTLQGISPPQNSSRLVTWRYPLDVSPSRSGAFRAVLR